MQIPSDQTRAHLKIQGRVQGVYFRASTVAQAQRFALTGWVRNCSDGSVEVVVEGSRAAIEDLIAWCRHGPDGARVAQVQIEWEQPQNNFAGFTIKR